MKCLYKSIAKCFLAIVVLSSMSGIVYYYRCSLLAGSQIQWTPTVSNETLSDSWGTWNTHYRESTKPEINYEAFSKAVAHGTYKLITIAEFLSMNVENHRLAKYPNAKTAEEAYPPNDRPRGRDDIQSVNYFVMTSKPVSPISVARVMTKDKVRLIKLDGVHRIIAAAIRRSCIKIFFIDL